jgi:prolyl-tRNA synthetase
MLTEAGEDLIYICKKCNTAINKEIKPENPKCPNCASPDFEEKKAVEVGNIFKLGTGFSKPFDLIFTDKDGHDKSVLMGCYGIGLSRLMGAVVESSHDERGIIWPQSLAPFLVHLVQVENNAKVKKSSEKLYADLHKKNIEVLYDDRPQKSVGEKFAESDLLGLPYRVVVSEKTLGKNSVEVKERNKRTPYLVKISKLKKILISHSS